MRRRSRAGGKPIKTRRRKAATLSRPNAPKVGGRRKPSNTNANPKNALLKRERDEALEQLSAASDVLKVISSSPGDLKPVFGAILENATRICAAQFGNMALFDGSELRIVAMHNAPRAFEELRSRNPVIGLERSVAGPVVRTKQVNHVVDLAAEEPYAGSVLAKVGGARTALAVPMLRRDTLIGVIAIYHLDVRPFTDKQIELLQNFAAQAVIAIENTRLLNELRQSLQQETATADVLKVISRSTFDLKAVLNTLVESAARLCEADMACIVRPHGSYVQFAATYGFSQAFTDVASATPIAAGRWTLSGRVLAEGQTVEIADVLADPDYTFSEAQKIAGFRSGLGVPLLREGMPIGVLNLWRSQVRPFTDKQIELVTTFAAQAVIAIENVRLFEAEQQRTRELSESLEQQTATSEVLQVISSSPGELEPVFQTMLANAVRICDAKFGTMLRYDSEALDTVALFSAPPAYAEFVRQRGSFQPGAGSALDLLLRTKDVVRIADASVELAPGGPSRLAGARSMVCVPMLKENMLIGAITIYRHEVRPFTDKQIELVQNFAAQAVIAIENTRLLNELRQRTTDLTESLEQQTATSEVLGVISSSPGTLEPVFKAMLENATRLCEANFGILHLHEGGGTFSITAAHNAPPAFAELQRREPLFRPSPQSAIGRAIATKGMVHIADYAEEPVYKQRDPIAVRLVELAGARTLLTIPMLKENELIGVISIYRKEVRPFTDKQIALVENFAAQAVIAIENTRLLNELRQSLEQQTATSEVLSVISSSPGDLEPVFETLLANAVRICGAKFGMLFLPEGDDGHRIVALHGAPPAFAEVRRREPVIRLNPATTLGRVAATKQVVQVEDIRADSAYTSDPTRSSLLDLSGARTMLNVPMLKDDELVGQIAIYRQEVRPFSERQIALVQNFAAQAVIAIENTRLLNELRQSLQQQTATADVLKVISRSTFDLQAVLNTLIESAARLCEADMGSINRQRGDAYRQVANYGHSPELQAHMDSHPIPAGHGSVVGRTVMAGKTIHIPDVLADPDYKMAESARIGGIHTMLGVPLLREGTPIGVIVLQRKAVRPFTEKQIELVTTFADQAVIAIENVRLFDEIQDKSRQLEVASQHKSQFLANMSHELRTPLNAILGYTELMADGIYGELPEKTMGVLKRLESNGRHLLGLINDVLDLSKIEAGQLVLELTDYSLEDIAQTVRSTLEPLAADKKLAFKVEVAPKMPPGHGDGRRLTQVLINLVGNAIKFTDAGEVVITAGATDGSFHLSVHDTGPGISDADQAKLFQEFQQADNAITRKKGGTGLGLAISKRIIEMHGGKIWVDSQVGQGSTFCFTVPVRAVQQVQTA
jgi:GAF domain-containing protein